MIMSILDFSTPSERNGSSLQRNTVYYLRDMMTNTVQHGKQKESWSEECD